MIRQSRTNQGERPACFYPARGPRRKRTAAPCPGDPNHGGTCAVAARAQVRDGLIEAIFTADEKRRGGSIQTSGLLDPC
jgi:hypothetical protein